MTSSEFEKLLKLAPSSQTIKEIAERIAAVEECASALFPSCEKVALLYKYAKALNMWLIIGGGFVINYLVLPSITEPPRFTYDLHTATPRKTTKKEALRQIPLINKELLRLGIGVGIETQKGRFYLGLLEHDVEKDALPYLLPVRVPVVTRWSGVPLWRYLERVGVRLKYNDIALIKRLSLETLGVDTPRVDFLRVGISIGLEPPVETLIGLNISSLKWQWRGKAAKLVSLLEEGRTDHDVLKALLDLRTVWAVEVEIEREVARRLLRLLPQAAEVGARYWSSHHYYLVRKKYQSPHEVAERLAATLRSSA